jgi:hypothetical protein
VPELNAELADGRRGDAVKLFMRLVGMPHILVSLFPLFPGWKKLRGFAHAALRCRLHGRHQAGLAA